MLNHGAVVRIGPVLLVYELLDDDPIDASPETGVALPGASLAMRRLRAQVAHVAADGSSVLVTGATGSGKEFVVRELHRASGRSGPLVAVNCAALSPHLFESELFGHVRGAFSGAHSDCRGLFRAAQGGTLFLDEIGELALELQAKLLRTLQERCIRPVGSTRDVPIDVRVLGATHRDLSSMVDAGTFRRDLLARLSPWELHVPSLCERRADIFKWIELLHATWRAERGLQLGHLRALRADAAEALLLDAWPENLRGLQRLVHQLSSAKHDAPPLKRRELPSWLLRDARDKPAPPAAAGCATRPAAPSKAELVEALSAHGGSVRATASYFCRERRQIYRWMDAYGLR